MIDEVRVDLKTVDFAVIADEVKVDDFTVESSTVVSVSVESQVTALLVHLELVGVFPFPEQSSAQEQPTTITEIKLENKIVSPSLHTIILTCHK